MVINLQIKQKYDIICLHWLRMSQQGVRKMSNKEKLNQFTDKGLEMIEEIVLSSDPAEIIKMISELKEERKQDKLVSWNAKYKVEDMVLDWDVLQTLKKNNINTLQQ